MFLQANLFTLSWRKSFGNSNKFDLWFFRDAPIFELDKTEDSKPLSRPEANFRKILKKHLARLLEYQNNYCKKR
jgi:hypothetical protein